MENSLFNITIDKQTGCITSIAHPKDKHFMNWCSEAASWGKIHSFNRLNFDDEKNLNLDLCIVDNDKSESRYFNDFISVTVNRYFKSNGNFVEKYTVRNLTDTVITINRDNFGIELPFNDRYTYADECMTNRCNTHIWCAHNTAWVNALRMGPSDINLGLVLTKGSIDSYSQNNCNSNTRGVFVLNSGTAMLTSGAEYEIEWEIFWHKGNDDFLYKLSNYKNIVQVCAKHYTVFRDETIDFTVKGSGISDIEVYCHGKKINTIYSGDEYSVKYTPETLGDFRFKICYNSVMYTYAEFTVKPSFGDLVKNRIHFIAEHQQCHNKKSPLYGAYLIYDNTSESTYFDDSFPDHNACRERIGMALLFAKYLQYKNDEKIAASLDLYISFLKREFYDEETGEVYNTIGKKRNMIRLYNAPWVMMLFGEMYYLTKDSSYLTEILKMADNYYKLGGKKFYPNGLEIVNIVNAFIDANMYEEAKIMKSYYDEHVNNMISNGLSYPKHEVNYEQTIVTPAATFISELGLISEAKEYYSKAASEHIACLKLFSGIQPSYHLYEIPIRYWDDYWFGKSRLFGDTFPHYWSCLTARSYIYYYKLTGERLYKESAEECLRNCMCLFTPDGRGSCAYVYPQSLNGIKGEFFDEWANDQDFALYFALSFMDEIETFRIV